MDVAGRFRRRVKQLIGRKYRSLDRFYLETGFSKGHLSEILRGKGSPSVSTLVKLASALEIDPVLLFIFPERGSKDRALESLVVAKPDAVRAVARVLGDFSEE